MDHLPACIFEVRNKEITWSGLIEVPMTRYMHFLPVYNARTIKPAYHS